jgi:hypothetical protein
MFKDRSELLIDKQERMVYYIEAKGVKDIKMSLTDAL